MKRVLVYTGGYRLDFPDRDIPLVKELRERGFEVNYCIGGPHIANMPHPREVVPDERSAQIQVTD